MKYISRVFCLTIYLSSLFAFADSNQIGPSEKYTIRAEGRLVALAAYGQNEKAAIKSLVQICESVRAMNFGDKAFLMAVQSVGTYTIDGDNTYAEGSCAIVGNGVSSYDALLVPLATELIDYSPIKQIGTISKTQVDEFLNSK